MHKDSKRLLDTLANHTSDTDVLAVVCEYLGDHEGAMKHRLAVLGDKIASSEFSYALQFGTEHGLLSADKENELAGMRFEQLLSQNSASKALELARERNWKDRRRRAAFAVITPVITNSGYDPDPGMEIVRNELSDYPDIVRRMVRIGYSRRIGKQSYCLWLSDLVAEFPLLFSEDEKNLAKAMSQMWLEEQRQNTA